MIIVIRVVLLIIFAIVFYVTVYPWLMIGVGINLLPNPQKPVITYGEFPFRLVYEINGETKVVEDILICEYDGIGMDEGQGKYRKWKGYLASGEERLLLLEVDNPAALRSNRKVVKQEIYYSTGSARYYMGDMKDYETYKQSFPDALYFEKYDDGGTSNGVIRADELYEKYRIKLKSWDYSQPIENEFT
ncbi:hypothetical protein [Anaerotignum propionicum]|uniref:hypothetical protein n=1 Tax=Anaerotignum propionicum TaxID=28446 RepID=UPI00210C5FD5|nr:hypothetical protein [Anaerotignum propionicum]MCQ4936301.1 hypothetical protein [Anaerotignum propionicum]